MVGRRMGRVVSNGRTEDGDGEGNGHGLIEELFQHLPRRSLENKKKLWSYLLITLSKFEPTVCYVTLYNITGVTTDRVLRNSVQHYWCNNPSSRPVHSPVFRCRSPTVPL